MQITVQSLNLNALCSGITFMQAFKSNFERRLAPPLMQEPRLLQQGTLESVLCSQPFSLFIDVIWFSHPWIANTERGVRIGRQSLLSQNECPCPGSLRSNWIQMLPFILQHRMRMRQIVVQQIVQFQFNILGPQFMDLSRPDPIIVVGRRGLDFISPYLSIQTEQSRHRAPKRPHSRRCHCCSLRFLSCLLCFQDTRKEP